MGTRIIQQPLHGGYMNQQQQPVYYIDSSRGDMQYMTIPT